MTRIRFSFLFCLMSLITDVSIYVLTDVSIYVLIDVLTDVLTDVIQRLHSVQSVCPSGHSRYCNKKNHFPPRPPL